MSIQSRAPSRGYTGVFQNILIREGLGLTAIEKVGLTNKGRDFLLQNPCCSHAKT